MSETISGDVGVEGAPQLDGFDQLGAELEAEGLLSDRSEDQDAPIDEENPETDHNDEPTELIKLKVNGKTVEKPLSEVVELAQKYQATEMKLETAKKEITEARKMQESIKGQQDAVKQLLGVMQRGDIATIAEFVTDKLGAGDVFNKSLISYALKLYEDSKMTPEQREAQQNRNLVEKYKREAEARQHEEQQRAFEYQVNQWTETINRDVPKALSDVGLPDTDFIRSHVISTWRTAVDNGQNPTAAAVAAYVKQQLADAKLLNQAAPKVAPTRPRATPESVGLRKQKDALDMETPYMGWEAWKASRGR